MRVAVGVRVQGKPGIEIRGSLLMQAVALAAGATWFIMHVDVVSHLLRQCARASERATGRSWVARACDRSYMARRPSSVRDESCSRYLNGSLPMGVEGTIHGTLRKSHWVYYIVRSFNFMSSSEAHSALQQNMCIVLYL